MVIYSVVLALLCLAPSDAFVDAPRLFPHADKLGHAIAFGGHASLFLRTRRTATSMRAILTAIVITTTYGGLLECLQPLLWTRTRTFSTGDIVADGIGAVLACCLTSYMASVKLRHAQRGDGVSVVD